MVLFPERSALLCNRSCSFQSIVRRFIDWLAYSWAVIKLGGNLISSEDNPATLAQAGYGNRLDRSASGRLPWDASSVCGAYQHPALPQHVSVHAILVLDDQG